MQHPGRLIFVTGYCGAGKSTLIRAAVKELPNLAYLTTITTRPQRDGEPSGEYTFVDPVEYERHRAASQQWDHSEFAGYSYGADVTAANEQLKKGMHLICGVTPDQTTIAQMKQRYLAPVTLLWIDTPLAVANARIVGDARRAARILANGQPQLALVRAAADTLLIPTQDLAVDTTAFMQLIAQLVGETV